MFERPSLRQVRHPRAWLCLTGRSLAYVGNHAGRQLCNEQAKEEDGHDQAKEQDHCLRHRRPNINIESGSPNLSNLRKLLLLAPLTERTRLHKTSQDITRQTINLQQLQLWRFHLVSTLRHRAFDGAMFENSGKGNQYFQRASKRASF